MLATYNVTITLKSMVLSVNPTKKEVFEEIGKEIIEAGIFPFIEDSMVIVNFEEV